MGDQGDYFSLCALQEHAYQNCCLDRSKTWALAEKSRPAVEWTVQAPGYLIPGSLWDNVSPTLLSTSSHD